MTDKELLLRAVLIDPSDDLARFACADARGESGDEDEGKFIHHQMVCSRVDHPDPVRRRLWKVHHNWQAYQCLYRRWLAAPKVPVRLPWVGVGEVPGPAPAWTPGLGSPEDDPADWVERLRVRSGQSWLEYRRGFVERVRMRLAGFLGEAEVLFRRQPIERVALLDRYPACRTTPASARWRCLGRYRLPASDCSVLPEELFDLLPPAGLGAAEWLGGTAAAALDALSLACVAYGRGLAGL